jgi:16S rRNA (adenine1518-N6/adenine1519-N6)-dimethyltransferase
MTETTMNLKDETRRILQAHAIRPRKRLGQSFLTDGDALQRMVFHADINKNDTVLEIGAGLGFLTELLAETAGKVTAVEVDSRLIQILRERLRNYTNVALVEGDILTLNFRGFGKVVSTPPYSISSPILFWLLERKYELAVLAFQEEFAKRLAAQAGSGDYGRLTVAVYCRAEVEFLDLIPKDRFWPSPNVDSRIVRLKPKRPPFIVDDEGFFSEVVRVIFAQKNKKLRNALVPLLSKSGVPKAEALGLADTLPFHSRRPRELAPEEIGLVANEAAKMLRRRP